MLRYAALNHELSTVIRNVYRSGSKVILDYAKENCSLDDAPHISKINMKMMTAIPGSIFAIKPTSFGSRVSPHIAFSYTEKVIQHAINNDCKVCIDAEDVIYPKESFDMMLKFNKYEPHVYKTYQMYRSGALKELETDLNLAEKYGIFIGVKLVRGAYVGKQPNLFSNKFDVDKSFRNGLDMCLNAGENVNTIVATHNKSDIKFARTCPHRRYKIAQLMGMSDDFPDYVYIPFGSLSELTPYLFRRLIERLKWS